MEAVIPKNGKSAKSSSETREILIAAPKIQTGRFKIIGTAPYVQARFSKKMEIMAKHEAGSTTKKGSKKAARDFDKEYKDAMYISREGWHGIPASSFRAAMVSACRLVGFKMTLAKLCIFIKPDGFDKHEGVPLIKIEGAPKMDVKAVRNHTGVMDLRARPMWEKWSAELVVQFDADTFSMEDIANLLARVGMQVGIGEGRPDSRESVGMGWGTFSLGQKE